tara:strand:+ start:59 stop:2242 length:2184 start_codon:yes stop_codon:yes gene_type:complete
MVDKNELSALEEKTEDERSYDSLVSYVEARYERAKTRRYSDEERWVQAYKNYRGIYGPDVQFTETEKSRVFIKVTKTKVLAAYGQLVDVLFSQNRFPIGVEPTALPDGVVDSVHVDPKEQEQEKALEQIKDIYGSPGDGNDLQPGDTTDTLTERLGPQKEELEDIEGLKEGPGQTQTAVTFHPAMVAAKKMEKKIKDQLEESSATKHLRHSVFECVLFGTAVMKGPFALDKEYANWDDKGDYDPIVKTIPRVEYVSVWDFYPDPDAYNMEDATYTVERHRLTRPQLRALKKRPFFRSKAIDDAIKMGENYNQEWWEESLNDNEVSSDFGGEGYASNNGDVERYEVLEFWGTIDKDIATIQNLEIPEKFLKDDEVQVNAWVCNGEILRFVINPFTPKRIPYVASPYELNPYSFFGVGLAENMDDTQTLMNGFMRLAVDNAVLSGNLLIEVDETNLAPGQDLTVYPGKIFRRQGGAPGQAIFGTKFPNVSSENMMLFDKARVLSDESSGLPSYSYGQTGVMGTGRTASGISMLMGAASNAIRTVIKNMDDYMLRPMGEALFAFNMQFDFDPEIKGDLEIRARGTESFMKNEVRSQRLISFLQIASSPVLAPFAKFPYIMREIASTMDLDVEKVTNSPEEAFRQALLLQQMQQQMVEQNQQTPQQMDPTGAGGGNIGTGQAPAPGEQGFATGGGQNTGTQQQQQQAQGGQEQQLPPELMAMLQQQAGGNA